MTLFAKVQDKLYTGFTSYSVSRSVTDLSGGFDLTMTSDGFTGILFKRGDAIKIFVDKTCILTGYIDAVSVSYDASSHDINISGRDKVADWVDSTIGEIIEFKPPITLERILEAVAKRTGLTDVKIINKAGPLKPFTQEEIVSGSLDETVFGFLEKYTKKRQVLMTSDGLGNVILTRAGQIKSQGSLKHYVESEELTKYNNILSGDVNYDNSDRFYEYRIHSQGNPAAEKNTDSSSKSIVNRTGVAYDPEVRKTRRLDKTSSSSATVDILEDMAKYEANIRRIRSMDCSYTVEYHHTVENGEPWHPNTLVDVIDEYFLINSPMLIETVTFSTGEDGELTKLDLVHPDAFMPEPEIEKNKKKKHGLGKKKKKGKRGIVGVSDPKADAELDALLKGE